MRENLKKAFSNANYAPKANLSLNIWQAIMRRSQRIAYIKLTVLSLVGLASLISLIPVFRALIADFSQSGFYEYLSLAFSNGESLITYWKEFISLLAESLPVESIIGSLTLTFIFLLSLTYLMKQIIRNKLILWKT